MSGEDEPTDDELLAIFSGADGWSDYDGWLALWRAGFEAASQREPTDAEIEAAARAIYETEGWLDGWDRAPEDTRVGVRNLARAALSARNTRENQ